ncbi:MAG: bifunctional precorrin-2 dehydrogenase/sirohydrochlorin ferrochelatase [Thermoplasmatales archaeon]
MKFVPIMLNTAGRKLLIIGGGKAAALKLKYLVSRFDKITVISDTFNDIAPTGNVEMIKLHIADTDILNEFVDSDTIVIIASDDDELNARIREYCEKKGILYNSVDRKDSPFIFPAVLYSNNVVVSVSTEGRSPSLSRFLKKKIAQTVEQYSSALPVVEKLRSDMRNMEHGKRAIYFENLFRHDNFWELVNKGDYDGALKLARSLLLLENPSKSSYEPIKNKNKLI